MHRFIKQELKKRYFTQLSNHCEQAVSGASEKLAYACCKQGSRDAGGHKEVCMRGEWHVQGLKRESAI